MTEVEAVQQLSPLKVQKMRRLISKTEALLEAQDVTARELKDLLVQIKPVLAGLVKQVEAQDTAVDPAVTELFDYWRQATGHVKAQLVPKWQRMLRARLDNYGLDQLKRIADLGATDPWLNGSDPKAPRAYNGIDTLFGSDSKVEKYLLQVQRSGGAATWKPQDASVEFENERI